MNKLLPSKWRAAFTLIELLVLIGVVTVLVVFLLPGFVNAKQRAQRIRCTSHLKQIGLSFRLWSSEHTNLYPMQVSMEFGGAKESAAIGATFRYFEIMSNELNSPLILACPSDNLRTPARSFVPSISNSNVSYFASLDAVEENPSMFLAGDRNILGGTLIGTNILELSSTNGVSWGRDLHKNQGNIALADGSVQGFSSSALRTALIIIGPTTNRLAMP